MLQILIALGVLGGSVLLFGVVLGGASAAFAVKKDGRIDEVLDEFRTRLRPDSIDVFENMALVATVGHGMSFRPGVSAKLFTALAEAGVNIRMIDQGSSEMNIIVGVENKDFETAIRAIYQAFVEA